jgi:hypothetical protein
VALATLGEAPSSSGSRSEPFQHWKFVIYSYDESLQVLKGHMEAEAADMITVLKRKYYSPVLFCRGIAGVVNVIHDK